MKKGQRKKADLCVQCIDIDRYREKERERDSQTRQAISTETHIQIERDKMRELHVDRVTYAQEVLTP